MPSSGREWLDGGSGCSTGRELVDPEPVGHASQLVSSFSTPSPPFVSGTAGSPESFSPSDTSSDDSSFSFVSVSPIDDGGLALPSRVSGTGLLLIGNMLTQ